MTLYRGAMSPSFFWKMIIAENKLNAKIYILQCTSLLAPSHGSMGLSTHAYHCILKIARADLDHNAAVTSSHITEAVQHRSLERGRCGITKIKGINRDGVAGIPVRNSGILKCLSIRFVGVKKIQYACNHVFGFVRQHQKVGAVGHPVHFGIRDGSVCVLGVNRVDIAVVGTGGNRQLCSFHETGRSVCGRNRPADSPGTGKTLSEKKRNPRNESRKGKKTIKRPGNKIRLSPGNYLDAFDLVYAPHHIDYGLSPVQNLEPQPFIICDEPLEFLFTEGTYGSGGKPDFLV